MSTRFALRHRANGRYMASHPDFGKLITTPDETEAVTWPTMTEADLFALAEGFEGSWDTVPVTREMMTDFLKGQSKGGGHREAE